MKLCIIGAGGHGKVAADIALRVGYSEVVFLDDSPELHFCAGLPVVGKVSDACCFEDVDCFVAVGNPEVRESIMENSANRFVSLVHPHAVISRRVTIGDGTIIMAGTVINSDSAIGRGCIINTGASVDHDCTIGDYVHVSVGAHVAGGVEVGERSWLGIGSSVSNNISICGDCMVGAGAVVVKNISFPGTYVGVPARAQTS